MAVSLNINKDFSTFLDTETNKRILIIVGDVVIKSSGCLLSQHSPVFKDLVLQHNELHLDEFVGLEKDVRDCLKLLYGGEVMLSVQNIQSVLKFSALYKIEGLFEVCLKWMTKEIGLDNFVVFNKIGSFIAAIDEKGCEVVKMCKTFVLHDQEECVTILEEEILKKEDNFHLVNLLIHEDYMDFTLPLLIKFIDSMEKAKVLMTKLEKTPGLVESLSLHSHLVSSLIQKMSEMTSQSLDLKRIVSLQGKLLKIKDIIRFFKSRAWRSFTFDQICAFIRDSTGYEYELSHFTKVEIMLDWARTINCTPLAPINELWILVQQNELSYDYLKCLELHLLKVNTTPPIEPIIFQCVDYMYTNVRSQVIENLLAGKPETFSKVLHCTDNRVCKIALTLHDNFPNYSTSVRVMSDYKEEMDFHPIRVVHCCFYVWMKQDFHERWTYKIVSLLTNTRPELRDMISCTENEEIKRCSILFSVQG